MLNLCSMPMLNPNVEKTLMQLLKNEVDEYSNSLQGTKCLLCPFRILSSLHYLKKHVVNHCDKNMFIASRRSPQRAVVRAVFDYFAATTPIALTVSTCPKLLHESAVLIRQWNHSCPYSTLESLQRTNLPVLVRVLTYMGPQYWAKVLTSMCIRHSKDIYYTPRFADLFLSMLLINQGRILSSVNALHVHFGSTNSTSTLLPTYSNFWNTLLHDLISHAHFKSTIISLKYKAAARGELAVISHDETFKTLFSIIGQVILLNLGGRGAT